MATTTTSSIAQGALGIYYERKVVESLQPYLFFEQFGTVEIVGQGNYTSRFYVFDAFATSQFGQLTEGTPPTALAFNVTVIDRAPLQYGINVEFTDLVQLTTVFDTVNTLLPEVGKVAARAIDSVIQTVVNAGTNVIYAGGKTSRNALGPTDLIDVNLILRAIARLINANAKPHSKIGAYACVMHPFVAYDLKSNTSVGQWIDIQKYAMPQVLLESTVGSIGGATIFQSGNVNTFNSNVTVYPTTLISDDAYRIAYWLPSKVNVYVLEPENNLSVNNPLGQKGSVGAKTNIAVARVQEARIVRIESAATSL